MNGNVDSNDYVNFYSQNNNDCFAIMNSHFNGDSDCNSNTDYNHDDSSYTKSKNSPIVYML
jgi:hypothetical protein